MIPQNLKLPDPPLKQALDLVDKMKQTIGTKEPIEYFDLLTQAVSMLLQQNILQLDQIKNLRAELNRVKTQSALSIQWEPKIALSMIEDKIAELRNQKDIYEYEINSLKDAYKEGKIIKSYNDFCYFWENVLGYHPFLT